MTKPCKECISYAICVSQEAIHCELLYNYARAYVDTDKGFWKSIHKIMPNCKEMSKDGTVSFYGRMRYGRPRGVVG